MARTYQEVIEMRDVPLHTIEHNQAIINLVNEAISEKVFSTDATIFLSDLQKLLVDMGAAAGTSPESLISALCKINPSFRRTDVGYSNHLIVGLVMLTAKYNNDEKKFHFQVAPIVSSSTASD